MTENMASPEQIYTDWRSSLKSPDESMFYYHPDLERILLGLSVFTISSRPLIRDLGNKYKSIDLLNIYVADLVTAWIDEDDEALETMFRLTMTIAESYLLALRAIEKESTSSNGKLRKLGAFYAHAIAAGGDMNPDLAQLLLEDLSTDGKEIYSTKIQEFGSDLLKLLQIYGLDIPIARLNHLNGW